MQDRQVPRYMRAVDAEEAEEFRRRTEAGDYDLLSSEMWWKDRIQILEDHGYQLRSRLTPGWSPSWKGTDINPLWCEDRLMSRYKKVVDAVRKRDGKDVVIMNLFRFSHERDIFQHLTDAQRSSGKDQHIVPMLDSFEDDREPDLAFFIMPLLRRFDSPPFETIPEVIDLFRQLLEGLIFMQKENVAHRDCSVGNIMMDAPSMFPNGFHPCNIMRDRGGVQDVKSVPRHKAAGPIIYYFIDFGILRRYGASEEHLVVGDDGADQSVPEMSNEDYYDPFPADVFILGNVFKKRFLLIYKNLKFLSPLVDAMTAKNPAARPTADGALKQFKSILSSQSYFKLRQQLVGKDETKDFKSVVLENVGILMNTVLHPVKVLIGTPSQIVGAVRGLKKA